MPQPSIRDEFDQLDAEHGAAVSIDARYLAKAVLAGVEAIIETLRQVGAAERRDAA